MTQEARLNVRIDKQLLQEARVKAIRNGTTLSHIIREFLTTYANPHHHSPSIRQEREALTRIAAAASPSAIATMRGPIVHPTGYFVWHFTTPDKHGRVRCQFHNHITGPPIPDKWELIWLEQPLERQPPPDSA